MEYINCLYFIVLFLYVFKHRGGSVSSYIVFSYLFSAICAIFVVNSDISQKYDSLSIVPTFVFWILVTLTIFPLIRLEAKGKLLLKVNVNTLKILSIFYFFSLILLIVLYWRDFLFIYAFGDYGELRKMILEGDSFTTNYSGLIGPIVIFIRVIVSLAFFMIPVFFILLLSNVSTIYLIMSLLGSLGSIAVGLLSLDRSNVMWWIVILGWSYFYFRKDLNKAHYKRMRPYLYVLLSILLLYFAIITISKFVDYDGGASSSIVNYAGQSYPNFCYFWDNFQAKEFSTKMLFPMTHHFILNDYEGIVALQELRSSETNMDFGVFYSFLGCFLIDGGHVAPFVFVFFFFVLFMFIISTIRNKKLSQNKFFMIFCFSMVPTTGTIAYFFSSAYAMFTGFFLYFFISFFDRVLPARNNPKLKS